MFIGTSLFGSPFVQDPIKDYVKIDNVTLGEAKEFGYGVIRGNDIGAILRSCLRDPQVVAVLYNWKEGVAYTKTGVGRASEAKLNPGYTSFIIKTRVNSFADPAPTSTFITAQGTDFMLDGQKFVPVGFNAFYLGLLQETMDWPSNSQITEAFETAKRMKATTIRSHTLGFSAQSAKSLLDADNHFNPPAWVAIDWAFVEARRCGIKLILVMTDPYEYYHGSYKTFCTPYNIPKDQFFTHPIARDNFKQYLFGYLNHVNIFTGIAIKNCTDVAMIELGNELGDYRPAAGSTAVPTQDWIADITAYIHSMTQILVLDGCDECLGSPTSNDFKIPSIDCFSRHFYYEDYNEITLFAKHALDAGKPFIIGEYSSKFGSEWFTAIENIPNVKGSFAWSLYPHKNGERVIHGDGFDFWFDFNSYENNAILMNLTNHFRRMQGLPVIKSLNEF